MRRSKSRIISNISNARYVDLTNLFCDATRCHTMIDGKLTFRDRHHIAAPYAASLAASARTGDLWGWRE